MDNKLREVHFPSSSYPNHTKIPLSEEGIPTNWAKGNEIAPGITIQFVLPKNSGDVTQYYSEERGNSTGVIDCSKDQGAGPSHIFACAYSTRSI